jgi:hypothetical protein
MITFTVVAFWTQLLSGWSLSKIGAEQAGGLLQRFGLVNFLRG